MHPLFQRDAVKLESPGARPSDSSIGLADQLVVWRKDDNGASAYMIAEGAGGYVPLVPDLAPGNYRATVVLTDPGNLAEPLYSNEVKFDYPFPNRKPLLP
ncbi:hypothetical protein D3C71_1957140 [compost metagenome]